MSGLERSAGPAARPAFDRAAAALIAAVAALLALWNLDNQYLWQDEAQTAVIARTILDHGIPLGSDGRNQFSQELGKEYGEGFVWKWHTWLSFYAAAASFALLGTDTFAARLPFALFGIASVALAYFAGLALWRSRHAAVAGAAMLALSVPFLIFERQCRYYSMTAFFSLLGLTAYARLRPGARGPTFALFAAATLLFHTHYVYAATLLAALLVHALLWERARLRPLLVASAAVVVIDLPWIVWFSSVRPGGEHYLDSVLDAGKALRFARDYVVLCARHLFDPRLLAIAPLLVGWAWWRGERPLAVAPGTRSGVALVLVFCTVNVVLLSVLSPLRFYRYLAPLAPPLALLSGLLIGALARRSLAAGAAAFALWLAAAPLPAYLGEITHDFDGPIEGLVGFLREHGRPGDVVAISYGDMPLKFYTDMRVVGGLTGEDLGDAERARWIVIRHATNTRADREVKQRLAAILREHPRRWRRHVLDFPDTAFENREDPAIHRFRSAPASLPRVVVWERRG